MSYVISLFTAFALLLGNGSLPAQGHRTHRHPGGAKIIMTGVLVEPLCHFAEGSATPRIQACLKSLTDEQLRPALLNRDDSTLYFLHNPVGRDLPMGQVRQLVGKSVKIDGTVFPAGNTYLIVVDSLKAEPR